MIPKVNCCVRSLLKASGAAHIIDGRIPYALLLEIFTDTGIGPMIKLKFVSRQARGKKNLLPIPSYLLISPPPFLLLRILSIIRDRGLGLDAPDHSIITD